MNVIDPFAPDYWIRARLLATEGGSVTIHGTSVAADAVAFCGVAGDPDADPPVASTIRAVPARDGFSPLEFLNDDDIEDGKTEADCWPYILFGPARDGYFDRYAQENVGLDGEYLIRAFHREDYTDGVDVEQANWPGFIAIQSAFQGVPFGAHRANDGIVQAGIVHGCEILRIHQRTYLPPDAAGGVARVSELGVIARLFST